MKLGKGSLLAIIETACFVIGAIFFVMVIAIPSNPVWALVVGIICGLTGAITWSCSLIIRTANKVGHKIHDQIEHTVVNKVDAEKVAQSILDDEDNTYELHRADSYNDLADEMLEKTEPTIESEPAPAPAPAVEEVKPEPQADKKATKKIPKPDKPAQPTEQEITAQQRAEKRKEAAAQFKALMSSSPSAPQTTTEATNPQPAPLNQEEAKVTQNEKSKTKPLKPAKPTKAKK